MNLEDLFRLSFTNLKNRRLRSWLTLLGIFAGIAAIVALISLGQGLEDAVTSQFETLGVNLLTVEGAGNAFGPPGSTAVGKITSQDVNLLKHLNGVDKVFGRYLKPSLVNYRGESDVLFVASIPPREDSNVIKEIFDLNLKEGRLVTNQDKSQVTIGSKVEINNLKPELGSKITFSGKEFTVAGILKKEGNFMVDKSVLMGENAMVDALDLSDEYSLIVLTIKDGEDVTLIKEAIERTLRHDRDEKMGEEDFVVSSPLDTIQSFMEILTIVQILLVGVAFISLIVGAIGILNTMYTSVLERRKEIGIMKSIGATNKQILSVFLIEAGLLGLLGGVIGLVLGIMISKSVEFGVKKFYEVNILQAAIPWWLIVGSLVFAFLVGGLAGVIPARQASRMNPVESLRK